MVLAGLPGAGKSTLLTRISTDAPITALDSEQVRAVLREVLPDRLPYRWYRVLVHVAHRSRIAWKCLTTSGPVVAHEPSTRSTTRALLLLVGLLTGRRRVLVWLHVDAATALAGQHARGRLIRGRSFRRHVRRAERFHRELLSARPPRGWNSIHVFSRDDLSRGLRLEIGG
ncbi:hypothetical protein GCM10010470_11860 [Saccharopolyspora taberi]|uniref:AAA domain-containing protein n=1 Tax=Saccharopolyspora taberi TaxID=60895 RepID=A0ABN3V667_9PSEU